MAETQRHEVVVRRGGGPGCIGIFLIIGFIALIAEDIGNHPGTWIPIIVVAAGVLIAFLVWKSNQAAQAQAAEAAKPAPPPEFKKCPECAEQIRFEAIRCRFCGADVGPPRSRAQTDLVSKVERAEAEREREGEG